MPWSDCFLSQSKYFDQLSHRKAKQKQSKKRFVRVTEKYLKTVFLSKNRVIFPAGVKDGRCLEANRETSTIK